MRIGLAISVLLHAALLAWAVVSIAETHEMKLPQPDPIIAEVVSASELNRMRQGVPRTTLLALVDQFSSRRSVGQSGQLVVHRGKRHDRPPFRTSHRRHLMKLSIITSSRDFCERRGCN